MAQVYVSEWGASTAKPHFSGFELQILASQLRLNYRVAFEKGKDGWIVVRCPSLKGAVSQGRDKSEALRNIVDAIFLILQDVHGVEAPEFSISWDEI
jgi:predicted RNase H-like HicB family nuclease